jgi:hypothetical protein
VTRGLSEQFARGNRGRGLCEGDGCERLRYVVSCGAMHFMVLRR